MVTPTASPSCHSTQDRWASSSRRSIRVAARATSSAKFGSRSHARMLSSAKRSTSAAVRTGRSSVAAGKAATRLGNGAVVVAGLLVLAASMLVRLVFSAETPIAVVGAVLALTAMGGAIIQTPQATVMMSSAPSSLGGVVSAVKAAVGGTFNGLGAALFSMFGIILFVRDAGAHLAGSGITPEQAGDVLSATPGSSALDPERARWVVSEATTSMLHVADALNLTLAAIAVVAAVVIGVLFRRGRGAVPAGG